MTWPLHILQCAHTTVNMKLLSLITVVTFLLNAGSHNNRKLRQNMSQYSSLLGECYLFYIKVTVFPPHFVQLHSISDILIKHSLTKKNCRLVVFNSFRRCCFSSNYNSNSTSSFHKEEVFGCVFGFASRC